MTLSAGTRSPSGLGPTLGRISGFALSFTKGRARRTIAKNLISLSLLQYASYVFPLFTVPYLTRVIGVSRFGLVAFAQATVAYFGILVNYGFSYSATRQVTIERESRERLRQIFSQVMWAKILLAVLGFMILVPLIFILPRYRHEPLLFFAAYTIVAGFVFTSEWFFQGMEEMKYITMAGLISRGVATGLVFVVVRHAADYVFVPLLAGLGTIAGGLTGQWIIWKKYRIGIGGLSLAGVWRQLREGGDTFLSMAFISLYTTSNVFFLGLLATPADVGYYSAAEKVVTGVRSLWGPIPQVLFPHFSKEYTRDVGSAKRQLRTVLLLTAGATLFVSLLGCVAAPVIVRYYLGPGFGTSTRIIQIMIFTVFIIGINNVLGVQGLLANGENVAFRNIVLVSGALNILLLILFVKMFGVVGPAVSVVLIELLIFGAEWVVLKRKGLL